MGIKHIVSTDNSCWNTLEDFKTDKDKIDEKDDTLELTGAKKQEILGFGGCFNELGWESLGYASESERMKFLDELFNPDKCNFNYGRIPIGANDFSLEWYSCDETPDDYDLKDFSIERDKKYTIPFIREAIKHQSDFTLFASPWSPPTWMKTHKAYNFGRIKMEEKVLKTYADYFVKFVKAYLDLGLDISQVHIQNEPMADQKFPSCLWYGEDMQVFIRDYIGPAFEKSGLSTEIWLGTINGPFVDFMMDGYSSPFHEFYDQFANTILSDSNARKYISGVGLQWGGKHVFQQIANSYPDMRYMMTESECGDGKNTWAHMEYIYNQMWFYIYNGAERYTYWNMSLEEGGVSTWGWEQNSLCTVNKESGMLTYRPEFYLMKHFSAYVKKGAVLLETKGRWASNVLAFENNDGSIILVAGNAMNKERELNFIHKDKNYTFSIPKHSVNTIIFD